MAKSVKRMSGCFDRAYEAKLRPIAGVLRNNRDAVEYMSLCNGPIPLEYIQDDLEGPAT